MARDPVGHPEPPNRLAVIEAMAAEHTIVDEHCPPEPLRRFGAEHRVRIGPGTPECLPRLLRGVSDEHIAIAPGVPPEPVRAAYHAAGYQPTRNVCPVWAPSIERR
ncbi:hypothetical protein [Embleya hyalina]|uniref:Uncharacterized protein n=1 Tax=Embleya hyalina TaxID=516124 RepID=A0A401Z6E1_9ACTN|nr:hypothetical protein [Embleya hyalina]GCE02417.1 hypothetical protein EHYA_10194 [Embleya hyalina]